MWNCSMLYINQLWTLFLSIYGFVLFQIFNNNFNLAVNVPYDDQCQVCQREREGEPLTEDELAVVQMHKADGRQGQAHKNAATVMTANDPTFAASCFDMMQVRFKNMFKYCPVINYVDIKHPL